MSYRGFLHDHLKPVIGHKLSKLRSNWLSLQPDYPYMLDNTTLLHCDGQVVGQLYASTQAHHWWSKILRTFHDCIYWLDVLWNKYTGYCVQLYYGYKRMRFEWTHYELIVIHLLSPIKTKRHCPEFHVDAILCYFKLSLNNPDVQFNEYLAK